MIPPSKENIELIEEIISSFVSQSCLISKQKIFAPLSSGGLGIPRVNTFLKSLDILLFKKSLKISDSWSLELHNNSLNNDDIFYYKENTNLENNPVLNRLINSYIDFQSAFWIDNGNIKDLRIFENRDFRNSFGNKLSRAFFTLPTWCQFSHKIKSLKFIDVISPENRALSYEAFVNKTSIILNHNEFFRMQSIIRYNLIKHSDKFLLPQLKIGDYLNRPNKKSKHFRAFFEFNSFRIDKCLTTSNRYNWASVNIIDLTRELRWQNSWHLSFLTINLKDFSFKLLNNKLKFNGHLAHFLDNQSAECTFCVMSNMRPAPKENIKHFFIDCPTSNNLYTNHFNNFLSNKPFNFSSDWTLLGAPSTLHASLAFILNIEILLISLFLFNCRARKLLPTQINLNYFISWNRSLLKKNRKYCINLSLFSNPFDPG